MKRSDISEPAKMVVLLALWGMIIGLSAGAVLALWFHFFWN